ncbi:MAG: hypothetical protein ACK5LR_06840 [Mangrovibacterium sp.]
MERRKFIQSLAVGGITVASLGLFGNAAKAFAQDKATNYEAAEAKRILTAHYQKIFQGSTIDINVLPEKGMITFADSFEIVMNENKVTVFDIADTLIPKLKEMGFDASMLKEGKIPEGMIVAGAGIAMEHEGTVNLLKDIGLRNYDAELVLYNSINLRYNVPASKWAKVKKFEVISDNESYKTYLSSKEEIRIFESKNSLAAGRTITINSLNPLLLNKDMGTERVVLDKKLLKEKFGLKFP